MAFAIHSRVGNYEILGRLGAGGMGEVYLARDMRLGREVALKALPPDLAGDPERLARLEREARTVAALNHPNIVTLFGVEEFGDTRLLVMERVTGKPLSALIDQGGLPVPRLLQLAIPIADALAAAHDKGIVHRDLKPANVMVTDEGRVKVLDFGLARAQAISASAESTKLAGGPMTGEGRVMGTIPYMAPEQLRGEGVDARADIFAFGTMLYEMASGVRPFRGDSTVDVVAAILREEPQPLEVRRPDLPPRLARLVRRCLEKDPRERVQSAIDLRHELQDVADVLRLRPATEERPAAAARVARPRRRIAVGVALGLAAVVLISGAVVMWMRGRAPAAPASREIRSIAVLPFDNFGHDASQDYFVEGLHEALITDLAKLGTVRVTSRNSVMRFKGQARPMKDVARELEVDALIEGSVLRAGDKVRITAQLILGRTDEHVWAESYDREVQDVLALLSDVSRAIAGEVQAKLDPASAPAALPAPVATPRVKPEAYEAYLRGRHAFNQMTSLKGAAEAFEYFQQAANLDPGLSGAWSGMAASQFVRWFLGGSLAAEVPASVRAAAEKALALDRSNGEAYSALAYLDLYVDWNFEAARPKFERAVALSPHDWMLRHGYADYLMDTGRFEESLEQVRLGRSFDPTSPIAQAVVIFHLMATRRYDEVVKEARRALELFPTVAMLRGLLADALWRQGRYEESLAEQKQLFGRDDRGWRVFEGAFRRSGPRGALKAYGDLLAERAKTSPVGPLGIAACYAEAGERDAAMAWLEKAYAARVPQILHVPADPAYDSMRGDPRFQDLLRRIGVVLPRHGK